MSSAFRAEIGSPGRDVLVFWGRDELGAGEMWNSNSLVSWLLARSGIDVEAIALPAGGRAPGWRAGIVVARRADARTGGAAPQPRP